MKKGALLSSVVLVIVILLSCFRENKKTATQQTLLQYQNDVDQLAKSIVDFMGVAKSNNTQALQTSFKTSRDAFKKIEWLAAYYNPLTAKGLNGPALPEVEASDKSIVIAPEGFQVIEELIFPVYDTASKTELLKALHMLASTAKRLQVVAASMETTDGHILDALRLQVFRIITLGISGFDSPIANNSIAEAKTSLQGMAQILVPYRLLAESKNRLIANQVKALMDSSIEFLSKAKDFNSFNRLEWISNYVNPFSESLISLQKVLGIPFFTEPRALKAIAPTLFADSIFNPDFYVPDARAYTSKAKVDLGEKLFYDAVLSDGGKRSCASCHNPQYAFTDGKKVAEALSGKMHLKRNTPTLINAGVQPFLFYDMRVSFLEDQAAEVIKNKDEMHGDFKKAIDQLNKQPVYKNLFKAAYANGIVSELEIKNALACYIRSLTMFTTSFDDYIRGRKAALSNQQVYGFNLFMGKAKCGTCHFTPLFNGVVPPDFGKMDAEIIGVPSSTDTVHTTLDSDEGKYLTYKIPLHRFAFKTPTLRNVAVTAPYMHNGVFKTLEEVIEFYNRGGGRGLGLAIENQTLPSQKLQLTSDEKKAVIAFLQALTDKQFISHK